MKKKVIAIIGCGRIAAGAHFPALSKIKGVSVKYACDLIEEKAVAMKEKYPELVKNVITDYNIALNDPEVEVVYVLTPNYSHYEVTMDALRAGKHVFCEKPITINYELSCKMAEEAKKQGKIVNIGVCNRYRNTVNKVKSLLESGKLGNVYHVYASFRRYRGIPGLGGDFTDKAKSGGGVLIDLGVHLFDLIFYILGGVKIKSISANAYNEIAKDMKSYKYHSMWSEETKNLDGVNDVDDFVTGYIRTDKTSLTFNGAWAQNVFEEEFYVDFLGDRGGVRFQYSDDLKFYDGDTLTSSTFKKGKSNIFELESRDFLKSLDLGEKTRNNIDEILETMKLLDYIYRSADSNKEVTF